jgi:hypothetical protein
LDKPRLADSESIQHASRREAPSTLLRNARMSISVILLGHRARDARALRARSISRRFLPRKVLQDIATFLDAATIREIINLLAPFTVDPIAVAPIPRIAFQKPPRDRVAVAINSRSQDTGDRYIQRARCHTDPWTVVRLANAGGHDQVDR